MGLRNKKGAWFFGGKELKKFEFWQQIMARWVYSWIEYRTLETLEYMANLYNILKVVCNVLSIKTDQMVI